MSELHRIMQQRPRGHPYPFGAAARADVDSEEYVELCRLAKQLQKAVPAFAPGGKPPTVYIDDPEAEKALRAAFEEDVPELLEAPALTEVLRILHSAKTLKVAVEAPDAVETAEALEVTGAPKAVERPEAPETADVLEVPKAVETAEAVEATGVPKAIETADAVETTSANSEPTWDAGVPWEIFELIVSNLAEQHDLLRCVCMDRQCTVCRERDLITDTFVFLHQTCRYLRRDPSHWQRCYESTLAQIVADCDYRVILQQLCRFRYRRRMWREKNIMDYLERQFPDYNAFLLHICQDTHTFQCLDRKRINRLASYFVKGLMYLQVRVGVVEHVPEFNTTHCSSYGKRSGSVERTFRVRSRRTIFPSATMLLTVSTTTTTIVARKSGRCHARSRLLSSNFCYARRRRST
jgi:hypothetical protein